MMASLNKLSVINMTLLAYSLVQPLKVFVCDMHMIRETTNGHFEQNFGILLTNACTLTQGDVVNYMHNMSVALEWQ